MEAHALMWAGIGSAIGFALCMLFCLPLYFAYLRQGQSLRFWDRGRRRVAAQVIPIQKRRERWVAGD